MRMMKVSMTRESSKMKKEKLISRSTNLKDIESTKLELDSILGMLYSMTLSNSTSLNSQR